MSIPQRFIESHNSPEVRVEIHENGYDVRAEWRYELTIFDRETDNLVGVKRFADLESARDYAQKALA